ncbi:MAG TPA: hypothetical protein VNH46_01520, partial [Gemmatimonadales bacterium]|nr:hypothetical protein [Gemmatimonadales bacterium]
LNNFGNLGDSTKAQRTSPTAVKGGLTFVKIVASQVHSCGLTSAQTVYCWGYNGNGRLAQDTLTVTEATGPIQVTGLSGVTDIVAGAGHTCARLGSGAVLCWGVNDSGQLGDGTLVSKDAATAVSLPSGVTGFVMIAAGSAHTCGVTSAGAVYCWGDDGSGQLGDNGTAAQPLPVQVLDP